MVMLIWECPRISITTRGATLAGRREKRDRAVPGVVQPDHAEVGGLGDAGEGAVEVARLGGTTGAGGEDAVQLLPPLPRLGASSHPPHPVPAQGRNAERGQRNGGRALPSRSVVVSTNSKSTLQT